jgi:hypothetical protein
MIEIKHRWNGRVLYTAQNAADIRTAVEEAVAASANLSLADLSSADLSLANLSLADLSSADLSSADLSLADLSSADLSSADLSSADDPRSPLNAIRADLWAILDEAPAEVGGLLLALRDGQVDGSTYEGSCRCLVGTIAAVRGCDYTDLEHIVPDGERPAESWFMPIKPGDVPGDKPEREGQFRTRLAMQWIGEWRESRERLVAVLAKVSS